MRKISELSNREILWIEKISNLLEIQEPFDEDDTLFAFFADVFEEVDQLKSHYSYLLSPNGKRRRKPFGLD